jgi:flavin reductase (DIM6/NTAB) family NADH-FMN oxidoreductase RutF
VVLECNVIKVVEIGLHTQFIGEILDVKADSSVLNERNLLDIEKVKPIIWNIAGMMYHKVGDPIGQAFSIGKKE